MGNYIPAAGDALQLGLYAMMILSAGTGVMLKVLAIRRKQLEIRRERERLEEEE
jgi:hypothetical protein